MNRLMLWDRRSLARVAVMFFAFFVIAILLPDAAMADPGAAAAAAAGALAGAPALGALATYTMQQLRERRDTIAKQMKEMHEKTPEGDWKKPDVSTKWDTLSNEVEDLDGHIRRRQQLLNAAAERQFDDLTGSAARVNVDKAVKMSAGRAAFNKLLRQGERALSQEEWISIRNSSPGGDPLGTVTGADGGYTVQTDVVQRIADALRQFGDMRSVAEVIQTAQGNPMSFPTSDGRSEEGELVAENQSASEENPSFGTIALNTYKFSSKVVSVPIELLQDSAVDIEAFIVNRLTQRLARATNRKFTLGTGSGEPKGIVTAATLAVTTDGAGSQTGCTYSELIDLVHAVDPAYRALGRARFMMNDDSLKVIRKIKDTTNRPIFIPGYDGALLGQVQPDRVLGYPIATNQFIAKMAAGATSILFGDFSFYKVRDVMNFTLFRFTDSAYAKKGQVGFLAWMRAGGTFVDVGGAVQYLRNAA